MPDPRYWRHASGFPTASLPSCQRTESIPSFCLLFRSFIPILQENDRTALRGNESEVHSAGPGSGDIGVQLCAHPHAPSTHHRHPERRLSVPTDKRASPLPSSRMFASPLEMKQHPTPLLWRSTLISIHSISIHGQLQLANHSLMEPHWLLLPH